jgi:hypothetical protein
VLRTFDGIDRDSIDRWAATLGVEKEWQRARDVADSKPREPLDGSSRS